VCVCERERVSERERKREREREREGGRERESERARERDREHVVKHTVYTVLLKQNRAHTHRADCTHCNTLPKLCNTL